VEKTKDIRLSEAERGNLTGENIGNALNQKRARLVDPIRHTYADELANSL
ncbi:MAG: hypothetical protein HKN88_05025, partial [Gammaproteobacteria bacterium]|nr:hypothetical protein [Gammaproteobacteria bacterium]